MLLPRRPGPQTSCSKQNHNKHTYNINHIKNMNNNHKINNKETEEH